MAGNFLQLALEISLGNVRFGRSLAQRVLDTLSMYPFGIRECPSGASLAMYPLVGIDGASLAMYPLGGSEGASLAMYPLVGSDGASLAKYLLHSYVRFWAVGSWASWACQGWFWGFLVSTLASLASWAGLCLHGSSWAGSWAHGPS